MSTDLELEAWREQWQTEAFIPASLRRNVERQSRRMKIGLLGDVLVTLIIGGGSTIWAFISKDHGITVVAQAAWLFIAAAWMFVLTANRGLWVPAALDAAAFLDLSIRRCRSALRMVWFAGVLFVAEVIFGLSWAYLHSSARQPVLQWLAFGSIRIDIVWICTVIFFVMLIWYRSKKRRELEQLLQMQDEMDPGSARG